MMWKKAVLDAMERGLIGRESADRLVVWLTEPDFADFHSELQTLVEAGEWADLDDRFYRIIEFGTGGRRGPRGAGTNRINRRTIAESAQGLADYIHEHGRPIRGVAVTFDTRHGSRAFARTICEVLAANGIPSFTYSSPRSTPQLSFTIRHLNAQAGCMISASHNPPSDNGIKVSWEDGGQVISPHDKGIIDNVTKVKHIRRMEFDQAIKDGWIRLLGDEIDTAYIDALETLSVSSNRLARIAYSPLHGVGATNVVALLDRLHFDLVTVDEQMIPDPEFSTVKNRLPNPELPAAMETVTTLAQQTGADLALASDPDADRIGASIPCPDWRDPSGWLFLNGNQIGALILDHVIRCIRQHHDLPPRPVVIKTIVTTDLLNAICDANGIRVVDNLLVGFKYIAEATAALDPEETVLFQTEESHGYNRGLFVRDKDAAPAAMHLAELASEMKSIGRSVFDRLMDLTREHGLFMELTRSVYYHGKAGMETMDRIMSALRGHPPASIGTRSVNRVIDRKSNEIKTSSGAVVGRIEQHTGNVMQFLFDETGRNRVTARPSGTEPKIKFYAQLWEPVPHHISDRDLEFMRRKLMDEANALIDDLSAQE
ncbi:phospho-sugar mutase [bacterium]|nr:phospho-sugar mutase [candidate division CSSED10-310 bacterium]